MAETFFKKLDADRDGKLTRTEMQGMVDHINAAAKAKGEQEYDLFKHLDTNQDGLPDPNPNANPNSSPTPTATQP